MRFFILLTMALSLSLAATYHTKMADTEVYVISLKTGPAPVSRLIAKNNKEKKLIEDYAKNPRDNEHNVMLLKNAKFTALVDTGYPDTTSKLKDELKKIGVEFKDITHIIITHAHPDHIGGILNKNKNNFPKARLLIDEKEYDYWLGANNESTKKALQVFKEKSFFQKDTALFDSELIIKALPAYGHTPGHNLISLENGKDKLVFIADLIHVYDVQVKNPKIAIEFDSDPQEAIKTRQQFLKEFKKNKVKITGVHLPFTEPLSIK